MAISGLEKMQLRFAGPPPSSLVPRDPRFAPLHADLSDRRHGQCIQQPPLQTPCAPPALEAQGAWYGSPSLCSLALSSLPISTQRLIIRRCCVTRNLSRFNRIRPQALRLRTRRGMERTKSDGGSCGLRWRAAGRRFHPMAGLLGSNGLQDLTPVAAGAGAAEGTPRPVYTWTGRWGKDVSLVGSYPPPDGGAPRLVAIVGGRGRWRLGRVGRRHRRLPGGSAVPQPALSCSYFPHLPAPRMAAPGSPQALTEAT
jgi:hypothetical protein